MLKLIISRLKKIQFEDTNNWFTLLEISPEDHENELSKNDFYLLFYVNAYFLFQNIVYMHYE